VSFFMICTASEAITPVNTHALFYDANQAYEKGEFETAIQKYESLLQTIPPTGSLYYNLGNCYFRLQKIGWAILYYERAKKLIPSDPDLDFNLRYARDQIEDEIEKQTSNPMIFMLENVSLAELFWFFVIINTLFWLMLIIRRWHQSEWSYYVLVGLTIIWGLSAMSLSIRWFNDIKDVRGVVVASEVIVRAGPEQNDTGLFKLHAGTIVQCERKDSEWQLIQFTHDKRGWVKSEDVIQIADNHASYF